MFNNHHEIVAQPCGRKTLHSTRKQMSTLLLHCAFYLVFSFRRYLDRVRTRGPRPKIYMEVDGQVTYRTGTLYPSNPGGTDTGTWSSQRSRRSSTPSGILQQSHPVHLPGCQSHRQRQPITASHFNAFCSEKSTSGYLHDHLKHLSIERNTGGWIQNKTFK